MAVIAIYSVKGGVGKTTTAANLAWCSATISCRKTLLWDLDVAGGAGFLFDVAPDHPRASLVLKRDVKATDAVIATAYDRLSLLPADDTLRELDTVLGRIGKRKRLARIAGKLGRTFERIILDCPPALGQISAQVMRAADVIIVPMPPSPLSARSFDLVVKEIKAHAKQHPPILPVLSMIDMRRNLHRQAREANPEWPVIPLSSVVEQCAVRREPVGVFAPGSPAARGYGQLWTAIERKLASL
ncbi:ParA family protein [Aurantiacibacter poecillastricola]|uniref:ParA family protein n=1 Tax=Aurantiacibacter poecillastricola TaxID=3064385 RepID=UPI00273E1916|nr:ParA family protein [Aurantiacibacter sp. 219JJ12-13]MDP5261003.1 ParA family protein [Aurantiacibacter sp. 219JJ12-13]